MEQEIGLSFYPGVNVRELKWRHSRSRRRAAAAAAAVGSFALASEKSFFFKPARSESALQPNQPAFFRLRSSLEFRLYMLVYDGR